LDEVIHKEVHDFRTEPCFLEYKDEEPMVEGGEELRDVESESTGGSSF